MAAFQDYAALLSDPNTIVLSSIYSSTPRGRLIRPIERWLKRAFDAYLLEGADLEIGLAEAQRQAEAYLMCVENGVEEDPAQDYPGCVEQVDAQ
jgi:hypothetical protein